MIRYLWDESTSHYPLKALRSAYPDLDIETVQALGLGGASDPTLIDWAVANDRVIVSQDRVLAGLAIERIRAGELIRLVIVEEGRASPGDIAEDLALLAYASRREDWYGPIFVPFRS